MNIEYRMSKEGPSEMDCRISRDKYLTILINIKNQSEAIPPFVIHYSLLDIRYLNTLLLQLSHSKALACLVPR